MKSINERFAALPIMMFGGSPMSVAVPPIFEAKISATRNGTAGMPSFLEIAKVIGITRITVVTLSKNALTTAVKTARVGSISMGIPCVSRNSLAAAKLKIPLRAATETIIIIAISKNTTLKSM